MLIELYESATVDPDETHHNVWRVDIEIEGGHRFSFTEGAEVLTVSTDGTLSIIPHTQNMILLKRM